MTVEQLRWKVLRAWCRDGAHRVEFGQHQHDDEYVEMPNGAGTSGESWRRITRQCAGGFFFTRMNWYCETCGRETDHEPKGVMWQAF